MFFSYYFLFLFGFRRTPTSTDFNLGTFQISELLKNSVLKSFLFLSLTAGAEDQKLLLEVLLLIASMKFDANHL